VKDRLLYVLDVSGSSLKINTFKGRINTAGTAFNASIRRYDATLVLRTGSPAKFIRPIDLELLFALAQARLWETHYGYGLPEIFRPKAEAMIQILQTLCSTGRFLYIDQPDALLVWSEEEPEPALGWVVWEDGRQGLAFQNARGASLQLFALGEASLWIDHTTGKIGRLANPVNEEIIRLITTGPAIEPRDVPNVAIGLPERLGNLALPRPKLTREVRRAARERTACLVLSSEQARDGLHYYSLSTQLPTLTLSFAYEGHVVSSLDSTPRFIEGDDVVMLERDLDWELECGLCLMKAGAVPIDELEVHWPGERMAACDYVFAEGEMNLQLHEVTTALDARDFAFRTVPALKREGWQITEENTWPFKLMEEEARLSVQTRTEAGPDFQGHDWFALGFSVELGGQSLDVAPLVAGFLEQFQSEWDDGALPDVETLRMALVEQPVYIARGKSLYTPLDLSPIASLLHLFLRHHAQLSAMHPVDAELAAEAEDALAGSNVRFADNAGILPLAKSLRDLAQSSDFKSPAGLNAQLRDYQAFGSAWMSSLLQAGFGGVLADDMGLGKTVQTLALLQARLEAGRSGPVLLIVPTSLLHTWKTQASSFTPQMRLLILHGTARKTMWNDVSAADLVITTYPLLARDRDQLARREWDLVILDEAQTLKNPASQMAKTLRDIPARGRLALTGTPLENSLQDVWTLIDWVVPGLLGDRKTFQSQFRTPIEKHGDVAAQARLNRRLRPFLLRRTKEQVAKELPPRTEILEIVDLPKAQQALYETVRSAMDARVREAISTRGLAASKITILDALLKLRQVCCDPALVKSDAARSVTDSAKRTRLRELLGELVAEGRRVLVFSQFVEMLNLIARDLEQMGIPYLSLTGQTQNRPEVLERFATGDAPVFLLSLKAGGVGLTLTEADTVILYDPWWNPAVERQAMDRTHRIGQDKPVFVHRLVARHTVEEKILEMQARKQALSDALFDPQSDTAGVILDELTLADLFAPLNA
jgi:superfamily II DNA or RNA helicase